MTMQHGHVMMLVIKNYFPKTFLQLPSMHSSLPSDVKLIRWNHPMASECCFTVPSIQMELLDVKLFGNLYKK